MSNEKPIPEGSDDESRSWWRRSTGGFLVGVVLMAITATGAVLIGIVLLVMAAQVLISLLFQ